MKTMQKTMGILAVLAMTGAATLITGCASSGSSGYKRADKTGASIASFRDEIVNGKNAIDATMKSLGDITETADTNPRKAYQQYTKDLAKLDSAADKIRKQAASMQEKGRAYFTQWEQEMAQVSNPDIRKLAEERKAKLQTAFDSIATTTQPLKDQFGPWMKDLKDLETYLGNDLTIAGVDAAKSALKKARDEGVEVQKAMDNLVAELNTIAAAITPANVDPEKQGQDSKQ